MITELDVETARLAIDVAAQDVADAEKLSPGPGAGAYWAGAQGRLRLTVARHARLVEQRAAELAAAEAFTAAEKAASKRLAAMAKEAAAGRDKVNAAVSAAQAALVALLDAIGERNATVAGHAAELTSLGLELQDGAEHKNGATRRGVVLLHGAWWSPVNAETLLQMVVERVKAARFGAHGGPEIAVRRLAKFLGLLDRADIGLEAVDLPPVVATMPPLVLTRAESFGGAPVGISEWQAEQEKRNREIKWTTPRSDEDLYGQKYSV